MNQKGFIPIILIVIGAVALASVTFGVVKYKDEVTATVLEIFVEPKVETPQLSDESEGQGEVVEEPEVIEEPIIEEPTLETAEVIEAVQSPEVIQPIEPEEAETGGEVAEEEIIEEEVTEETEEIIEEEAVEEEIIEEEVVEEEIIEEEVSRPEVPSRPSYAAVRAPSDIIPPVISDIEVSDRTENSAVITWHTNENGSGRVEYDLAVDSYQFLTSGTISEAYIGYDNTVFLSDLFGNTVYHFKVVSIDKSKNQNLAEIEGNTFLTLIDLPIITSPNPNNEYLNAEDDEDSGTEGMQINFVGTAEPNAFVSIQVNSSYYEPAVAVDDKGDWEQPDVALGEGENTITFKVENNAGNKSRDVVLVLYADSQIPTTTIETNYDSENPSYDFIVSWSSAEYPLVLFDVQYEDQGEWIDWEMNTSLISKDFTASEDGTYVFRARATDLAGNTGEWSEVEVEVTVEEAEGEYQDGLENGYEAGWNVGVEAGYDYGYWDGYRAGYGGVEGEEYQEEYDYGYWDLDDGGYWEGYAAGEVDVDGENVGSGDSYSNGYWDGWDVGYDEGYYDEWDGHNAGYNAGEEEGAADEDEEAGFGEDEGYDIGYRDGYKVGYEDERP